MKATSILYQFFFLSILSCFGCRSYKSITNDQQIGSTYYLKTIASAKPGQIIDSLQYPTTYKYVRRVINNLLQTGNVVHTKDFAWRITLIRAPNTINAFCLPGGYIFIYTGLLHFVDDEAELAGIVGHEIAHADLRHSIKQIRQQNRLAVLGTVANLATGIPIGGVAATLAARSFSRSDEAEADRKSVDYLYPTAYDARSVGRFFQKMVSQSKSGDKGYTFLSTHPSDALRVASVQKYWQSLGGKQGQTFQDDYKAFLLTCPK